MEDALIFGFTIDLDRSHGIRGAIRDSEGEAGWGWRPETVFLPAGGGAAHSGQAPPSPPHMAGGGKAGKKPEKKREKSLQMPGGCGIILGRDCT